MPNSRMLLPALLGLLAAAGPAAACTITSTGVAFGTYDPKSSTARTGFGTVAIDCHPNSRPVIALGGGLGGSVFQRRMSNGKSSLVYNLYTDAGLTSVWGDGTGGTLAISTPKRGGTYTVYGSIPAGQNVTAGTYSDVLVVTVIF